MKALLTSAWLFAAFAQAIPESRQSAPHIAAYYIEGVLEQGLDLPYNQILNTLLEEPEIEFTMDFLHGLRAAKVFKEKSVDCLFPGSKKLNDEDILESIPIYEAKAYFFAEQAIGASGLVNKNTAQLKIGFYRGNTFGGNLHKLSHHQLIAINSGADPIEMIEKGRINIFLNYFPDAINLVRSVEKGLLVFVEEDPFYSQNDSFLCHANQENRDFVNKLNLKIRQLIQTGQLTSSLY